MKKIFLFSLFVFLFSLFFVKGVNAATCSQLLLGGQCINKSLPDECYKTASGASDCNATTQICCQADPPTCTSKGGTCEASRDCTGTVNTSYTCPTGTGVCCIPPPPPTYTCTNTPGQYCSPESCSIDGDINSSDTCPTGKRCCKTVSQPPPSSGGYDCEASGCVAHTGAGSGSYDTLFACNKDCTLGANGGQCPICTSPYYYDPYTGKCALFRDSTGTTYSTPEYKTCSAEQVCKPGCGCNCTLPKGFTNGALPCGSEGVKCYTALGWINLDPASLVKAFFGIVLSISGGIAVLLIILSGYRLIASQGNPEKIKEAQEHLTAAIIGLLFVIFSFSILRFIGVDVLNILAQ